MSDDWQQDPQCAECWVGIVELQLAGKENHVENVKLILAACVCNPPTFGLLRKEAAENMRIRMDRHNLITYKGCRFRLQDNGVVERVKFTLKGKGET